MSEIDVVGYLASKGWHGRPVSGGSEMVFPCFLGCGESPGSRKQKLYVNAADGWFHCKVCGSQGGSFLLQQHFGDDPARQRVGESNTASRRKILTEATEVATQMLANNTDALLYLMDERGLSPETIIERKLGWIGNGWSLVGSLAGEYTTEELETTGLLKEPTSRKDFYFRHLLIPYQSRGSVTQLRGRIWPENGFKSGKYWTGRGIDPDLFGREELQDAEDALIVEGEFDAMVVKQHLSTCPEVRLRRFAVVGVPGVEAMKADWVSYFDGVKRIYIALDPDDAGKRAALKYKELFGTRARIITLPEELPKCDWSSFLLPVPADASATWHREHPHAGHDWRDIQRLIHSATGRRLYTLAEAGASWRQYQDENPQGIKTGFAQLDAIIEPGLLPGQLLILLAKTGTGKTVLLCNLAMNMLHRRVLFVTLEMTREEIYMRLRRIYLFWYPRASDADIDAAFDKLMICDENKLSESDFKQLVEEYALDKGEKPEVVFVDYLGYYARGQRGGTAYEKVTTAVMQLKAEAKAHRVVVISPAQVNRSVEQGRPIELDGARDGGTIEESADFLLAAFRPDDAQATDGPAHPTGKLRMQALKSRHGNAGRVFTLQMDLLSLSVVDDNTEAAKKAQQHNHLAWRGYSWDDMRARELQPRQMSMEPEARR